MTGKTSILAVALFVGCFLASGCGTYGNKSGGSSGTPGLNDIAISSFAFNPPTKTVAKGTTVTWVNQDPTDHDVHQTSGPEYFKSPSLGKDDRWSYQFKTPGTYTYRCDFHPGMTGTIIVTP